MTLRVPYALDSTGRIVSPEHADASAFTCVDCGAVLLLRGGTGKKVQRHFYHQAESGCGPETWQHKMAKHLVAQVVNDFAAGRGPAPAVERRCAREDCKQVWSEPLPSRIRRAVVEHTLKSGRIADVALFDGDRVVAIVEIRVTHAVDEEKMGGLIVPCAELDAEAVLESPLLWRALPSTARPRTCPACREADARLDAAGVPHWIHNLAPVDGYDEIWFQVERRDRDLHITSGYEDRWRIFDVVVARLARAVSSSEWARSHTARRAHVARRQSEHPELPEHVSFYWQVEAALVHFGGEWVPVPEGDWGEERLGVER